MISPTVISVSIISFIVVILIIVCIFRSRKKKPVAPQTPNPLVPSLKTISSVQNKIVRHNPTQKSVKFKDQIITLSNKIEDLKRDMGQMVMKSTTGDREKIMMMYNELMGKYNGRMIAELAYSLPPSLCDDLNLDGSTINDPVIKMYNKNNRLFMELVRIGLIPMLGETLAMSHWVQYANNKAFSGFSYFVSCLRKIDWSSKDVWSSINARTGHVGKCIQ